MDLVWYLLQKGCTLGVKICGKVTQKQAFVSDIQAPSTFVWFVWNIQDHWLQFNMRNLSIFVSSTAICLSEDAISIAVNVTRLCLVGSHKLQSLLCRWKM